MGGILKEAVVIVNEEAKRDDREDFVFLFHEYFVEAIRNGVPLKGELDYALCTPKCIVHTLPAFTFLLIFPFPFQTCTCPLIGCR